MANWRCGATSSDTSGTLDQAERTIFIQQLQLFKVAKKKWKPLHPPIRSTSLLLESFQKFGLCLLLSSIQLSLSRRACSRDHRQLARFPQLFQNFVRNRALCDGHSPGFDTPATKCSEGENIDFLLRGDPRRSQPKSFMNELAWIPSMLARRCVGSLWPRVWIRFLAVLCAKRRGKETIRFAMWKYVKAIN